jgi:hypothetical protein
VATNSNFLVKATDAKLPDVKKALEAAGINVRSIIVLHKETEEAGSGEGAEENKES